MEYKPKTYKACYFPIFVFPRYVFFHNSLNAASQQLRVRKMPNYALHAA